MKTLKASVPASIRKTAKVASKNKFDAATRPSLMTVRVTNKEAIAMDGYLLVIRTFDEPNELPDGESIHIPAAILTNSALNLKEGSKNRLVIEEASTPWGYKEKLTISKGSTSVSCTPCDTEFPPSWKTLWHNALHHKEAGRVGFTVSILKKFLEAVEDDQYISFRIPQRIGAPIICRTAHSRGIIMPAMTYHTQETRDGFADWDDSSLGKELR